MSDYHIGVITNKDLGSEAFVRKLLTEWCNDIDEALRPEFFDLGEPIKRSFLSEGIDAAVQSWVSSGMGLLLKRRSRPNFEVTINWFERKQGVDLRVFPWSCTVWLSHDAGDGLCLTLLQFLIRQFAPVFGHATTNDEYRQKHFVTFEDRNEVVETYQGVEVGETLPGIYWVTYFGRWAVEKIGEKRFADLKADKVERINSGYLVQAYSSPSDAGSSLAQEAGTRIMNRLGKVHFFSKAAVDIEALKTSPEEAKLVEEKIEELKAKKRQVK